MPSPDEVQHLFDEVAPWYDGMNRGMSLGLDRVWRRRVARLTATRPDLRVLDVGTGTADLATAVACRGARPVVGVDFSREMLARGQDKVARAGQGGRIFLVQGDALALPFATDSFDIVLSGFLLRNLPERWPAFVEMGRVARAGARLICLEIAYPRFRPWRALFRLYFGRLVPLLGRWLTGVAPAYRYLPDSLARFPSAEEVMAELQGAGWETGPTHWLFPGVVVVYTATWPAPACGRSAPGVPIRPGEQTSHDLPEHPVKRSPSGKPP